MSIILPGDNKQTGELSHRGVDALIKGMRYKRASVTLFKDFLNNIKPYIDKGHCKVRFVNHSMMDHLAELLADEEKNGYYIVTQYKLWFDKKMDKDMFRGIKLLLILKKKQDIMESEMMDGLENSSVFKL